MTPKEKADELVNKFYNIVYLDIDYEKAKYSALIAVNELIESHLLLTTTHEKELSIRCKKYWQEVKKEIEAL